MDKPVGEDLVGEILRLQAKVAELKSRPDDDSDVRDAMLFRFWVRAASESPHETATAIAHCLTPDAYRVALKALALRKGVNLP